MRSRACGSPPCALRREAFSVRVLKLCFRESQFSFLISLSKLQSPWGARLFEIRR